ncbi:MAG TPA: hypothetical protein VFE23_00585 [Usitatibacter sp.]|nr:hypothetical protein [Usitatibacter sp.]
MNTIIDSIAAVVLGAGVVCIFSPAPGSFWGNTFFGVPYRIAIFAVPLVAAGSAALARIIVSRKFGRSTVIRRGLLVGTIAFVLYGLAHTVAYAGFAVYRTSEGALSAIAGAAWFGAAMLMFGGLFFLPVCCAISVFSEWIGDRIAA